MRAATALADASEADAERALSEATRLCAGYLGTLNAIQAALLELVEGCVLTQQPRLDEQHAQWLVAHVRTLHRWGARRHWTPRRRGGLGCRAPGCARLQLAGETLTSPRVPFPASLPPGSRPHAATPPNTSTASCACCRGSCTSRHTRPSRRPRCGASRPRSAKRRRRRALRSSRWGALAAAAGAATARHFHTRPPWQSGGVVRARRLPLAAAAPAALRRTIAQECASGRCAPPPLRSTQVSAQLLGYQECGPEFADVVAQYSQVKVPPRRGGAGVPLCRPPRTPCEAWATVRARLGRVDRSAPSARHALPPLPLSISPSQEEMRQVERALHHFSALERELAEDDE